MDKKVLLIAGIAVVGLWFLTKSRGCPTPNCANWESRALAAVWSHPGDPGYDPTWDCGNKGIINIQDISRVRQACVPHA